MATNKDISFLLVRSPYMRWAGEFNFQFNFRIRAELASYQNYSASSSASATAANHSTRIKPQLWPMIKTYDDLVAGWLVEHIKQQRDSTNKQATEAAADTATDEEFCQVTILCRSSSSMKLSKSTRQLWQPKQASMVVNLATGQ